MLLAAPEKLRSTIGLPALPVASAIAMLESNALLTLSDILNFSKYTLSHGDISFKLICAKGCHSCGVILVASSPLSSKRTGRKNAHKDPIKNPMGRSVTTISLTCYDCSHEED